MTDRAPEAVLWDFPRGALMTKALGTVADLEIADKLLDGPRPTAELAREAGVDADVLHRLLRALASDGVFEEGDPGVFGHTDASRKLLDTGWSEFAHLFGGVFYDAVADLDAATRSGAPTFEKRFGEEFWPSLGARPDERAIFDRAMSGVLAGGRERTEPEWRALPETTGFERARIEDGLIEARCP